MEEQYAPLTTELSLQPFPAQTVFVSIFIEIEFSTVHYLDYIIQWVFFFSIFTVEQTSPQSVVEHFLLTPQRNPARLNSLSLTIAIAEHWASPNPLLFLWVLLLSVFVMHDFLSQALLLGILFSRFTHVALFID